MKILHCLNHFLPDQIAGTEVYTWALCKGLQSKNIIAEVAIPNYGKTETESYVYDDVNVYKFAEPSIVDRKLIMGFRIAEGVLHFKKLLTQINPDIVHFHELAGSNGFTIQHVVAAKQMGFKTVMTFHLASYSCKSGNLMYKDEKLCDGIIDERRCTRCMFSIMVPPLLSKPLSATATLFYNLNIDVTKANQKVGTALGYPFLIKKLRDDLHLLENNLDKIVSLTNWYQKVLTDNEIANEKITVIHQALVPQTNNNKNVELTANTHEKLRLIFLGRISKFKGLHLILDAFEKLPKNKISLDLYGLDPDDEYSKNCRQKMEKMENVIWKGWLEPEMVVASLKKYDALILASTFSEMSPLVIQEAFAAGIPTIASNVYGNAEQIVHNENGFLFEFNNSVSLKNLLQELISDATKVVKAKSNIKQPGSFEDLTNKYVRVYEEILTK